ncbi:MAG TPA: RHS repeat-associated core domain-containing protein [Gammaproteobacteria bacterium]
MAFIRRAHSLPAFFFSLLLTFSTAGAVDLDGSHLAVPGDFNADGRLDVLLQPLTTRDRGSLVLQDGTGALSVVAQGWDPGYLGLDWSAGASVVTTADLNGDGQDDVLVQPARTGGNAAVLITDPSVQLLHVSQVIPANYLSVDWAAAAHGIVTGDFDGDRHRELFLQAMKRKGTGLIVHADAAGHLVGATQAFVDGYLGRFWSAADETFYVGDFNGDARDDLLVQSKRRGSGESVYALLLADGAGRFTRLSQTWNNRDLGADWNPATHVILIEDANGDGIMDITLRSKNGGTNSLFEGNTQGGFTRATVKWNGDKSATEALRDAGKPVNGGISIVAAPGPTANIITAPTDPEQDPVVVRGTQGTQGSGQIMTVNAVGNMQGQPGVSGGTATYSIPVALPPGISGMQPSIALSYSSRGGNGEMGMGWSVSAGSQVHRCPATEAMDGYSNGVTYGSSDRLCLDGQHLIRVSGSAYGHDGAVYRTELDSFARITETGDMDTDTSSFKVEDKDGHERRYGYGSNIGASKNTVFRAYDTAAGAVMTKPLAWGLGMEVDTYNNSIIYYYSSFGLGEYLLTRVTYTGSGATDGNREVDFNYLARSDASSQYLAGGLTQQTQILSSVSTVENGAVVSTYNLEYADSVATRRSLLTGVQQCGGSGAGRLCLPETTFTWHDPATSFDSPVSIDSQDACGLSSVRVTGYQPTTSSVGDINGDGFRDLLHYRSGCDATIYLMGHGGQLTGSYVVTDVSNPSNSIFADVLPSTETDIDNDGTADLIGEAKDGAWLAYSRFTGSGLGAAVKLRDDANNAIHYSYQVQEPGGAQTVNSIVAITDANGDGRADIVALMPDPDTSGNWMLGVYLNDTPPCGGTCTPEFNSIPLRMYTAPNYTDGNGFVRVLSAGPVGDMDGNGLPDFGVSYISGGVSKSYWLFTQRTPGIGFTAVSQDADGRTQEGRVGMQLDINGDGLPDMVYDCTLQKDWCYALNTGKPGTGLFGPEVNTGSLDAQAGNDNAKAGMLQADIDNDGLAELIYPSILKSEYCIRVTQGSEPVDKCAYSTGQTLPANEDLSIYQYAVLRFVPQLVAGAYVYKPVGGTTGIIAQAHLAAPMDLEGDGLSDVVSPFTKWYADGYFIDQGTYTRPIGPHMSSNTASSTSSLNAAPDLMTDATDGFGVTASWNYYPLSSSKTYGGVPLYASPATGSGGAYAGDGYFYFSSSMYVVGDYSVSDGIGGTNVHDFHYGQAIYSGQGRGFQGFRTVVEDNVEVGSRTVQVYHQRFPLSGTLEESWTMPVAEGVDLVAPVPPANHHYVDHVANTWGCLKKNETAGLTVDGITCSKLLDAGTFVPVLTRSIETRYDVGSYALLSTTDTQYCPVSGGACAGGLGYDMYANPLGSVSTTTDAGGTYVSSVSNTYASDTTSWWLDKLTSSTKTVDAGYTANDPAAVSRTTTYTYDGGRSLNVVDALGDGAATEITTDYDHDARGNVSKVTVSGGSGATAVGPRITTTTYTTGADAFYFVKTVTNPMGHVTTITPDPRFGSPSLVTDPNGVKTAYGYDVFGRKVSTQVTDPISLPEQVIQYLPGNDGSCDGAAVPAAYYVLVNQEGAPSHYSCYDKLGRVIREVTESFSSNGDNIAQRTDYDALGRVTRVNEPHFGAEAIRWNTRAYATDILGRLTDMTTRGVHTHYDYDGFSTTVTTSASGVADRVDVETRNAIGKMLSVTNASGTTDAAATSYQYDSDGNPVKIIAADATHIDAVYNILGQKVEVTDPDQGHSVYVYDALGDLKQQTDGNNQTIVMAYDNLGRMVSKTAPEGISTWCYDSQACDGSNTAPYIGKLRIAASPGGYQQNYMYDGNGRLNHVRDVIDGASYDTDTTFDADGRIDTVTYPASVANAVPTASAGSNQYVPPGATVTLHGSATDADAAPNPVLYRWTQSAGPAADLSDGTATTPTFTATSTLGTTYSFQLTADDGLSAGSDTVNVTVPSAPTTPNGMNAGADPDRDGDYTVSWNAVAVTGTTMKYHLEEAGTDTSSAPPASAYTEIALVTGTSRVVSHPGNGHYYYWYRVKAENFIGSSPVGTSGYSGADSIHLVVAPGTPSSISPTAASSTTGSYSVSWGAYTGALPSSKVFYELQEDTATGWPSPTLVYTGTSRSKSFSGKGLGEYYYRVRACNQDGALKACSDYLGRAFIEVTGSGGCPNCNPQIVAPGDGSIAAAVPASPDLLAAARHSGESRNPALSQLASTEPLTSVDPIQLSDPTRVALATVQAPRKQPNLSARPEFAPPLYKAWAGAHLESATTTYPVARLSVKYAYTANGYLWKLTSGVDPNRVYWQVNSFAGGTGSTDAAGNFYEHGMDAHGNVVVADSGANLSTHYSYDPLTRYMVETSTSLSGSGTVQDMTFQWTPTGNLTQRSDVLTGASEAFHYDLHNRLLDSTVTNAGGTQPMVSYSYNSVGNITQKVEGTNTTTYAYGFGTDHPHAVATLSGAATASYNYDADGNMSCRDSAGLSCTGTPTGNVVWDSDNQPTNITEGSNYSNFSYASDKHKYKEVAMASGTQTTTLYIGGLEIETTGTTVEYHHNMTAYGRPVLLDKFVTDTATGNPAETQDYLLTDHLGSVTTTVEGASNIVGHRNYDSFGRKRDPGTWTGTGSGSSATKTHGYTDHEDLDHLNLVHMQGRVYDPKLGRFMSVDPVFQAPTNTQSVNPYSYVMNNPLSLVDPSGYMSVACPGGAYESGCAGGGLHCDLWCDPPGQIRPRNDEKKAKDRDAHAGSHIPGRADAFASCSGRCEITEENVGNGAHLKQAIADMQHLPKGASDIDRATALANVTGLGFFRDDNGDYHFEDIPTALTPADIEALTSPDTVKLATNLAGVVNHETLGMHDSPLENERLSEAKDKIVHQRLNAVRAFGDKVDERSGMMPPLMSGAGYREAFSITVRAMVEDRAGIDPTNGAVHYNMRTPDQDFAGRPFRYGGAVHTQSGPYISPTPYTYIETYGP